MAPRPDTTRAQVVCVPDARVALLRGDGLADGNEYILPMGMNVDMVLARLTVRAVWRDLALCEVCIGNYPITAAQLAGAWVVRHAEA